MLYTRYYHSSMGAFHIFLNVQMITKSRTGSHNEFLKQPIFDIEYFYGKEEFKKNVGVFNNLSRTLHFSLPLPAKQHSKHFTCSKLTIQTLEKC